jgi:hypothetical protein
VKGLEKDNGRPSLNIFNGVNLKHFDLRFATCAKRRLIEMRSAAEVVTLTATGRLICVSLYIRESLFVNILNDCYFLNSF